MEHISILLEESIDGLNVKPDGIYVDGTLGRGGHSAYILKQIQNGMLYAFDQDQSAIDESLERLAQVGNNFTLIHRNFIHIKEELLKRGISEVDGMFFDLGVSSPQFDDGERGFSYNKEARLDMRMDKTQTKDAYYVVNEYAYGDLVRILFRYGEEQCAKQIARAIEKQRAISPIETTTQLVDLIKQAMPKKLQINKHPAKKTFQALRIEVNDELKSLEVMLDECIPLLKVNGRMSVITFHSLEDRIVKDKFNEVATVKNPPKNIPILAKDLQANYRLINKKVILPNENEMLDNPRSKSAKLRIVEKIK